MTDQSEKKEKKIGTDSKLAPPAEPGIPFQGMKMAPPDEPGRIKIREIKMAPPTEPTPKPKKQTSPS
jgi:hypothetical protein